MSSPRPDLANAQAVFAAGVALAVMLIALRVTPLGAQSIPLTKSASTLTWVDLACEEYDTSIAGLRDHFDELSRRSRSPESSCENIAEQDAMILSRLDDRDIYYHTECNAEGRIIRISILSNVNKFTDKELADVARLSMLESFFLHDPSGSFFIPTPVTNSAVAEFIKLPRLREFYLGGAPHVTDEIVPIVRESNLQFVTFADCNSMSWDAVESLNCRKMLAMFIPGN